MSMNRKSVGGFNTGTAITGVICGTTIASVAIGGRNRSQYVTRCNSRQGTEALPCAERMAAASVSGLFASQTGSMTVSQKSVAFCSVGCRKKA